MRQKTCFSVVENDIKKHVFASAFVSKMRGLIWGYLGQMAHRRQIAQWSGTRTAHPGGTRFEAGVRDQYLPKTRECVWPFPQGLFMSPKTRPQGFFTAKNRVFEA